LQKELADFHLYWNWNVVELETQMLKEPNDCGKADQRGWFNAGGVLLSTSHGTLHRSLQDFNRFAHLICSFAQKEYLLFLGSEKGRTVSYFPVSGQTRS